MNESIKAIVDILQTMTVKHQKCVLEMVLILKEAWEPEV